MVTLRVRVFGLSPTIWLVIQFAAAALAVGVWLGRVAPNLGRMPQPRLLVEVWAPIALLIPAVCAGAFVGHGVHKGEHWMPIVGLVLCAMFATGLALWRRDAHGGASGRLMSAGYSASVWTVTGGVLLMLAAADVLTVIVGQCVFAAGAIVLWINTPSERDVESAPPGNDALAAQRCGSFGLLLVFFLAVVHGFAVIGGGAGRMELTAGIALATTLAMLMGAVVIGPGNIARRLAGWTASLGVVFAIGVLSMLHMLPHALSVIRNGGEQPLPYGAMPTIEVARGFAAVAPEAAGLIAIGVVALAGDRLPGMTRRVVGAILALVSICLVLWRVL